MSLDMRGAAWRLVVAGIGLALFGMPGCNSAPKQGQNPAPSPASPAKSQQAKTAPAGSRPRPSMSCYIDRTLNAPAPFHLSWKLDDAQGHSDWEADVSASTIDGSSTGPNGTRKIHGDRANLDSWRAAYAALPLSSESGHFRMLYTAGALTAAGSESVNGYDTVRYTVDTSQATGIGASLVQSAMGAGGSMKGTAWADKDGCIVKLVADEAWQAGNGSVTKKHIETGMVKK